MSDAPVIAKMSRDEIESGLGWRWRTDPVRGMIRDPNAVVLCARVCENAADPGVIAGFGIMQYGFETAHLNLLAVDPSFRRQGIANDLLAWLERSALVAGVGAITLEVRTTNSSGRAFYRQLGYRECEHLRHYYQGPDGAKESAYRMRRRLRDREFVASSENFFSRPND